MIDKVNIPDGRIGVAEVRRFKVEDDELARVRALFNGGRYCPAGEYTMLKVRGQLVMSDTPDEMSDHWQAVRKAQGHCLIMGLGLGMVVTAIAKKPEVTKITVIEIEQNVIDLVGPYMPEGVEIICADALEWQPPKGVRYGMVWHDIWSSMCVDQIPERARLKRRFGRKADWQGDWGREVIDRDRRRYG